MDPLSPGTRLGRYEIRSKIGAGGMGEVYLAEDKQLHRKVALKILPAELIQNKDRLRRFELEAQSAAAHAYALSGKRVEALKIIDELNALSSHTYVPPYNIAIVYLGLGDKDRTIEWLERAYAERSFYLPFIKADPHMDAFHSDPRFAEFVKRVGLQP